MSGTDEYGKRGEEILAFFGILIALVVGISVVGWLYYSPHETTIKVQRKYNDNTASLVGGVPTIIAEGGTVFNCKVPFWDGTPTTTRKSRGTHAGRKNLSHHLLRLGWHSGSIFTHEYRLRRGGKNIDHYS